MPINTSPQQQPTSAWPFGNPQSGGWSSTGEQPGGGFAGWQYRGTPVPEVTRCAYCGSVPAAKTTFRAHHGFLIVMRFSARRGPFCRDCGLATFRELTAQTLVLGWWGVLSFFLAPLTILINLVRRFKVARLAAPRPLNPAGDAPAPMDPGRSLFLRPSILGLAVPILFFTWVVNFASAATDSPSLCVRGGGTEGTLVTCGQTHDFKVIDTVTDEANCPDETDATMTKAASKRIYCLVTD